jgi:formate dehydrogenase maturation protein FdhE
LIEQKAPTALSDAAGEMASLSVDSWIEEMEEYWRHGGIDDPPNGSFAQFLPRAFLQPYAEFRAGRTERVPLEPTVNLCPLCGGATIAWNVEDREGDGGKRFLLCSFCSARVGVSADLLRVLR